MRPAMAVPERLDAVLRFKPFDRLPIIEWAAWWSLTLKRWQEEGLPVDADTFDFFGLDRLCQAWFCGCDFGRLPKPASHGAPILATMDDYVRLRPGVFSHDAPLDFEESWWREKMAAQREGKAAVWFTLDGFFWLPRKLLGIEAHLYAFYDDPELIHRINADLADRHLRLIARIKAHGAPVFMTFAEDMSYNHGSLLSEALFDEFMLPYYRKVLPALRELGTLPLIDSDGDISEPLKWFERAGLAGILPLERQAGVDVARLRRDHPGLVFMGAFDKMTMPLGEEAMRAEWERLLPTLRRGGFAPGVDHQTPPGVSLENYQIYLRLFREYARRAAE